MWSQLCGMDQCGIQYSNLSSPQPNQPFSCLGGPGVNFSSMPSLAGENHSETTGRAASLPEEQRRGNKMAAAASCRRHGIHERERVSHHNRATRVSTGYFVGRDCFRIWWWKPFPALWQSLLLPSPSQFPPLIPPPPRLQPALPLNCVAGAPASHSTCTELQHWLAQLQHGRPFLSRKCFTAHLRQAELVVQTYCQR